MVSRMAHQYPYGFEITYRRGNKITNYDTTDDDGTDNNYDPTNNAYDTFDTPPDKSYDNSTYGHSIYDLEKEYTAID